MQPNGKSAHLAAEGQGLDIAAGVETAEAPVKSQRRTRRMGEITKRISGYYQDYTKGRQDGSKQMSKEAL